MRPKNEIFSNNIKRVMDLPGGMYAVQLTSKNAAWRESNKLNLRMSDWGIRNSIGTDEYYSIRSVNDHACVMFRVHDNSVFMCRGMNRSRPVKYTNQVVTFIVESGFGIAADMACTGLIYQNNRYYNVYDLPKNFIVLGDMDLSYAGLRHLPDMKGMTIRGNYDISGNALVGFSGVPSVVGGDFIARNNRIPNVTDRRPQHIIIHGKFINDNYQR